MPSGRCERLADLPSGIAVLLDEPRAVMSTVDPEGKPHAVPVVFAVVDGRIVSPIDKKPKSGRPLGRLRNLARHPYASFLVDRWSDEWTELAWLMIRGSAELRPASDVTGEVEAIIERYPRYRDTIEGNDVISLTPQRLSWWSWTSPD